MLTEPQAMTKFCPAALTSYSMPKCHGSVCMAWRWDQADFNRKTAEYYEEAIRQGYSTETPPVRKGYCGLAGRPE